jgi:hypothetical protein
MSDLIQRLRAADFGWSGDALCIDAQIGAEGADEIERLRAQIASATEPTLLLDLTDEQVALCERLIRYSDDIHCIAVHRDLSNDLREAEALITLLVGEARSVRAILS